jgi:magnesium chelatase accessory protein
VSAALDWHADGADWPHRTTSRFVEAAGIRWHVQAMGHGPALLLIHGTGASTHSWRDLMPLLARDFSCLAVDLPGHAFTTMPTDGRLSLAAISAGLAALLREVDVRPSVVVGHSAGAAIAARLCLQEQVDATAIVSLNGAFFPLPGVSGLLFPAFARVLASTSLSSRLFASHARDRGVVRRLIEQTGSRLDARGEALYGQLVRNPAHVAGALGMMADWDVTGLPASLPRLRQKLHLVAGAADRTVRPEQSRRILEMVPTADLKLLDRLGHLAHEEQPPRIARLVVDAVKSRL